MKMSPRMLYKLQNSHYPVRLCAKLPDIEQEKTLIIRDNSQELPEILKLSNTDYLQLVSLTEFKIIYDISPLFNMKNIVALDLFNTQISELPENTALSTIEILDVSRNKIIDKLQIQKLFVIRNLQKLNLSQNNIQMLTGLDISMTNITELYLSKNEINDQQSLFFISGFKNLRVLDLSFNKIGSLSGFQLKPLKKLILANNFINKKVDLQLVMFELCIEELNLQYNEIATLFEIQLSSSLMNVNLSFNNINQHKDLAMLFSSNVKVMDLAANDILSLQNLPISTSIVVLNLALNPLNTLRNTIHAFSLPNLEQLNLHLVYAPLISKGGLKLKKLLISYLYGQNSSIFLNFPMLEEPTCRNLQKILRTHDIIYYPSNMCRYEALVAHQSLQRTFCIKFDQFKQDKRNHDITVHNKLIELRISQQKLQNICQSIQNELISGKQ